MLIVTEFVTGRVTLWSSWLLGFIEEKNYDEEKTKKPTVYCRFEEESVKMTPEARGLGPGPLDSSRLPPLARPKSH